MLYVRFSYSSLGYIGTMIVHMHLYDLYIDWEYAVTHQTRNSQPIRLKCKDMRFDEFQLPIIPQTYFQLALLMDF